MRIEESGGGAHHARTDAELAAGRREPVSRRQVLGQMTVVATAGATAWVVPEILTATPAAGASMSAPPGTTTGSGSGAPGGGGGGVSTLASNTGAPATSSSSTGSGASPPPPAPGELANTGDDLSRDAAIGAGLIAGGWALQRWASRTPKGRPGNRGPGETPIAADPLSS